MAAETEEGVASEATAVVAVGVIEGEAGQEVGIRPKSRGDGGSVLTQPRWLRRPRTRVFARR